MSEMIVTGGLARSIDENSFADITAVAVTSLVRGQDGVEVTFASDLTPAQVNLVQRRMASRNANEEELRRLAEVALTNNRAYVAIPSPTQAQAGAQVQALTRQMNGVIRQLLGFLDGTD